MDMRWKTRLTPREIADEFIIATNWTDVSREESRRLVETITDPLETLIVEMYPPAAIMEISTGVRFAREWRLTCL